VCLLKMVSLEWRSLRVTEESSKVLKVGHGGDLTMTAESQCCCIAVVFLLTTSTKVAEDLNG